MHPDVTTFRSRPPEKEFAHDLKTGNVDCDDSRDNDYHATNEINKKKKNPHKFIKQIC